MWDKYLSMITSGHRVCYHSTIKYKLFPAVVIGLLLYSDCVKLGLLKAPKSSRDVTCYFVGHDKSQGVGPLYL